MPTLRATAPGSTDLRIAGTAARDGSTVDLGVNGSADSALANTTLRTRSVSVGDAAVVDGDLQPGDEEGRLAAVQSIAGPSGRYAR